MDPIFCKILCSSKLYSAELEFGHNKTLKEYQLRFEPNLCIHLSDLESETYLSMADDESKSPFS